MIPNATPRKKKGPSKRLSARPTSGGYRPRLAMNNNRGVTHVSHIDENYMMEYNENQQKRYNDRFWGIDKERTDQLLDLEMMAIEDLASKQLAFNTFIEEEKKKWDEEYNHFVSQNRSKAILETDQSVQQYLRRFYNGLSANKLDLIPPVSVLPQTNSPSKTTSQTGSRNQIASRHTTTRNHTASRSTSRPTRVEPLPRRVGVPTVTTNDSDEPLPNFSFATFKYDLGDTRNKNIHIKHHIHHDNRKSQASSNHIDTIHGHPKYGWNQHKILETIFQKISEKGILTPGNLKLLSESPELLYLLKFTVFGSYAKMKDWDIFLALFIDKNSLSLEEWLDAARQLTVQKNVKCMNIRLDSEHRSICESLYRCKSSDQRAAFESRLKYDDLLQAYNVQRNAHIDDLVWTRIGSHSSIWLPAVVEAIEIDDDEEDGRCGAIYHLRYPFTESELSKIALRTLEGHSIDDYQVVNGKNQRKLYGDIWRKLFENENQAAVTDLLDRLANKDYRLGYLGIDSLYSETRFKSVTIPSLKSFVLHVYAEKSEMSREEFIEIMVAIEDVCVYREISHEKKHVASS